MKGSPPCERYEVATISKVVSSSSDMQISEVVPSRSDLQIREVAPLHYGDAN